METWFWILGWVLSFLIILGNGITIFFVCSRGNLRTKTNAFIVSLAVADFCVGLSVIPSLFLCDFKNTCHWPQHWLSWVNLIRWLFGYTSVVNLCVLVLDRHCPSSKINYFYDSPSHHPSYFLLLDCNS